jgi:DNA-directed RNA polymerase specialized sigma24 family protein
MSWASRRLAAQQAEAAAWLAENSCELKSLDAKEQRNNAHIILPPRDGRNIPMPDRSTGDKHKKWGDMSWMLEQSSDEAEAAAEAAALHEQKLQLLETLLSSDTVRVKARDRERIQVMLLDQLTPTQAAEKFGITRQAMHQSIARVVAACKDVVQAAGGGA